LSPGTPSVFIDGILENPIPESSTNTIVAIDPVTGQLYSTTDFANKVAKQEKKIEEQQASIAELKSTVAQQQKGMEVLTAQIKEQAAQIQKVSAQLEVSKPAPQVVTNKP
jgi:septal ring factor EnvC (AmiA/AmiB activator)